MSSRRLQFLVLGVVVGCGVAVFVVARHRDGPGDGHNQAEPPATAAEVADLRAEVAQLRQLPASRSWERSSMLAPAARVADPAKAAPEDRQAAPTRARQDEPLTVEKMEQGARRSRETSGSEVSPARRRDACRAARRRVGRPTQDSIRKALTQPELSGYTLNNVQCGKSLCRLDVWNERCCAGGDSDGAGAGST